MNNSELIYDWNNNHPPGLKPPGPVLLNDESLRDGLPVSYTHLDVYKRQE